MVAHPGQECGDFQAYCMAHKGKAASNISFSLDDPASAYSNSSIHTRVNEYVSAVRSVHGEDYDPSTEPIDGEVVMRLGGGKKHVRLWIGDSIVDSAPLSLSQI